jgi:hypothetical protein
VSYGAYVPLHRAGENGFPCFIRYASIVDKVKEIKIKIPDNIHPGLSGHFYSVISHVTLVYGTLNRM